MRPSTKLSQTLVAADVRRLQSPSLEKPTTEEEIRASSRRLLREKEAMTALRGDLDWIVMKCLEKDRTRRYDTANGLAADLTRHLTNEPVIARPPSAAYRFQKAFRRNRLAFTAGTVVVVALTLGIVFSSWQAAVATRALRRESQANKKLEAQIAVIKKSAQDKMELALVSLKKPSLNEAIERITQATQLDSEVALYHRLRGDFLQTDLQLPEALLAYETALKTEPRDALALTNLFLTRSLLQAGKDRPRQLAMLRAELIAQDRRAEANIVDEQIRGGHALPKPVGSPRRPNTSNG